MAGKVRGPGQALAAQLLLLAVRGAAGLHVDAHACEEFMVVGPRHGVRRALACFPLDCTPDGA
eukprot:14993252-Alexandrium_andersonii.AAC.1